MAGAITIDFDPIRDALYDWLHIAVNGTLAENDPNAIPVIRAEDDDTRPNAGFIEYKFLTSFIRIGRDNLVFDTDRDSFVLKGQREFTISVNVIGEKSSECAAQILMCLDSPASQDILCRAGLALRGENVFTDSTVFLETDHEERQVLDFRFGVSLEKLDAVTRIEEVKVTNNLESRSEDFTVTIN